MEAITKARSIKASCEEQAELLRNHAALAYATVHTGHPLALVSVHVACIQKLQSRRGFEEAGHGYDRVLYAKTYKSSRAV